MVAVEGLGVEAPADGDHLRTPETCLGNVRSERFGSPDRLPLNHWALAGEWTIGRENVVLDQAGGSIAYRFHARDAHFVLARGARVHAAVAQARRGPPPHAGLAAADPD